MNRLRESRQIVPEAFPGAGTGKSISAAHNWHAVGRSRSLSDLKYIFHIIYKEGLSFDCKDTGICANSRSCLLIFRFECFISIIIKENSYFCYFF